MAKQSDADRILAAIEASTAKIVAAVNRLGGRTGATGDSESDILAGGVVTITEAAELLRVEKRTVQQMLHDGQIPYTRVRSKPVIPRVAVEKYLASGLVPAAR